MQLDVAFANDLLVHEFTHGITSRMTGGDGSATGLQTLEALGLGEGKDFHQSSSVNSLFFPRVGWSDAMAW